MHNQRTAHRTKLNFTATTQSCNKRTKAVTEQIIQIDPLEGIYALGNLFSHKYLIQ